MINQKYKIINLLGQGRSSVYLCEDNAVPGEKIAIKILPANADNSEEELFINEFFTLRKINHPNIIKAFNLGTVIKTDKDSKGIEPGGKYFTLEYFNGKSLLECDELKDEAVFKEIIKQLCSVLYYLHLSNYIYYDLKPENILVSVNNGKPVVKLIDLGFAQYVVGNKDAVIRGTAEYIAPEILKNEKHNYLVDFYSLGMVLYRLIYKRFPFDTKNEIEVYKSQIEQEFDFPETDFPAEIIDTVKKLLKKNPAERHQNAIQILNNLDIEINEEQYKDWMPAKVLAGRKSFLTILKTYIADKTSREVFTIRGSEGAGKTSLVYALYSDIENSIFIENDTSLNGFDFIKSFLKTIVYTPFVYPTLPNELIERVTQFCDSQPSNLIEEFNSIISFISSSSKFVLILDAFNSYDDFTAELFKSIIPILQVNHIKVILTENSDKHCLSEFISNLREINLGPFTESQLSEYLEMSFAEYFPADKLKQLILSYADLLPGSLESFLKDLILLGIIKFTSEGIEITTDENTSVVLKNSHEEIYKLRINNLTHNELQAARLLSAFEISLNLNFISKYLNSAENDTLAVLEKLSQKNIIHNLTFGANAVYTSDGLKRFIYSNIKKKKNYHNEITMFLSGNFPEFNRNEFARHYELAGNYDDSYKILNEELINAEKISAYSYQKNILQHILTFPLAGQNALNAKIEYCRVLTKLNEYQPALNLIDELTADSINEAVKIDLLILKANCLIGLGKLDEGKKFLESLIETISEPAKRNGLLLDLANVNFNLNQYENTKKLCNKLISMDNIDNEILGSSYQLLGLIAIYSSNDLDSALEYFEKTNTAYKKGELKFRQAGILMNIGNIYSMKDVQERALSYWQESLNLNQSIGNIQQEARLLINFGIYYFNSLDFERSNENYNKSYSIFNSLGIKDGQGLVDSNMGEIFLLMCEYQKAFDSLNESIDIFRQLQNKEEELQALFLLGKLYFSVGDFAKLNELLIEYEKHGEPTDVHKINYEYLLNLSRIPGGDLNSILQSLTDLRASIPVDERKYDYFYCSMAIADIMIKLNILDEAAGELRSQNINDLCSGNIVFEAERNYKFGTICELNPLLGTKSPIDYYLTANELIENLHITELTWKVLFALFKTYSSRGNINKSREYAKYSKSLIMFIAENIKDNRLRRIYLAADERKKALEELNYYEEQF